MTDSAIGRFKFIKAHGQQSSASGKFPLADMVFILEGLGPDYAPVNVAYSAAVSSQCGLRSVATAGVRQLVV